MSSPTFIIERFFDAPGQKIWDALTQNEQMKKWYFNLPDFRPVVGFEFSFKGGVDENNPYTHLCRVTEVVPGKKLAYSWRYDGYPGDSTVSFELFGEDGKTRLKLSHSGLETFDRSNPDFARTNFEQGWASILDISFRSFLEKQG